MRYVNASNTEDNIFGSLTHLLPGKIFPGCRSRAGLLPRCQLAICCRAGVRLSYANDEYTRQRQRHLPWHINWRDNLAVAANNVRRGSPNMLIALVNPANALRLVCCWFSAEHVCNCSCWWLWAKLFSWLWSNAWQGCIASKEQHFLEFQRSRYWVQTVGFELPWSSFVS